MTPSPHRPQEGAPLDTFHAYAVAYADGTDERVNTLADAQERIRAAKTVDHAAQLFPATIVHFGTAGDRTGIPVEEHRLQDA